MNFKEDVRDGIHHRADEWQAFCFFSLSCIFSSILHDETRQEQARCL